MRAAAMQHAVLYLHVPPCFLSAIFPTKSSQKFNVYQAVEQAVDILQPPEYIRFMFLWGLLAAILGSSAIGAGQVLQKYAVNRLANHPPTVAGSRRSTEASRITDVRWILGIVLTYIGEIGGNFVALSYLSAAVVTPLGIIAVIVNAYLAERFLKEPISPQQRTGYLVTLLGVLIILWAAPKDELLIGSTPSELLQYCTTGHFILTALVVFAAQGTLIYNIIVLKQEDLPFFVGVSGLFGAINVCCGKLISIALRLLATAPASAKDASSFSVGVFVGLLIAILVGSIVGNEFFKQRALTKFAQSKFQPTLYAGFNAW
ncbi:hypothetical protein HDV00_003523 [Rhizophlyctis rosea]|nr:hypothetical protein HDV00_003523 [Rhizophlyctis rosea]